MYLLLFCNIDFTLHVFQPSCIPIMIYRLIPYVSPKLYQFFSIWLLMIVTIVKVARRTLFSTNRYVLFLRYGVNKTLHTLRIFWRPLLVCINTVFSNFCLNTNGFNLFLRALAGVPRVATTSSYCLFHIPYFLQFPYQIQLFLNLLNVIIIYYYVIRYSEVNYLAFTVLFINGNHVRGSGSYKMGSVCTVKPQKILQESFSMTASV